MDFRCGPVARTGGGGDARLILPKEVGGGESRGDDGKEGDGPFPGTREGGEENKRAESAPAF